MSHEFAQAGRQSHPAATCTSGYLPMRVLMTSTSYPRDSLDWRGVFIRHLAAALGRRSDVDLELWAPPGELPANVRSVTPSGDAQWLKHLMDHGGISHLLRHPGPAALYAPFRLLRMLAKAYRRGSDASLFHVNWLQCALPAPANDTPILMTVLGNDMKLLRLPGMRSLLRRTMRGRRTAICPNSEWMVGPLCDAFGDVATIAPVSFGIDPIWYQIERSIVSESPLWIAVTRLTRGKLGPLFEWSEQIFRDQARKLHLFGPMQEQTDIPEWIVYHGATSPNELATTWFPRATGLVTLSRHAEGRPQVMLEAMAAGIPIIASDLSAHASIVQPDRTGMLCANQDDYVRAIELLEEPHTNRRLGAAARCWAESEIGTWDDCASRYVHLYRQLLESVAHG